MKKLWGFGAALALFAVGSMLGQLSQSGGAGSSVNATQVGTWTMQPGNIANTKPWLASLSQNGNTAQVTSGGALKIDGTEVMQPVSGTLTMVPKTACGTTAYDSGMLTIPTVSTAITASSTCVNGIIFVNTTGQGQTVSLTDNQGTPVTYLGGFTIPANSTFVYDLQYAKLAAGIRWSAVNASSVNAQIVGFQ
jgi:hypothetical protein